MVLADSRRNDLVEHNAGSSGNGFDLESPRLLFPIVTGTTPIESADVDRSFRLSQVGMGRLPDREIHRNCQQNDDRKVDREELRHGDGDANRDQHGHNGEHDGGTQQ